MKMEPSFCIYRLLKIWTRTDPKRLVLEEKSEEPWMEVEDRRMQLCLYTDLQNFERRPIKYRERPRLFSKKLRLPAVFLSQLICILCSRRHFPLPIDLYIEPSIPCSWAASVR